MNQQKGLIFLWALLSSSLPPSPPPSLQTVYLGIRNQFHNPDRHTLTQLKSLNIRTERRAQHAQHTQVLHSRYLYKTKWRRRDESKLTYFVQLVSYSIGLWDTFHAEDLHLDVVPAWNGIGNVRDTLLVDLQEQRDSPNPKGRDSPWPSHSPGIHPGVFQCKDSSPVATPKRREGFTLGYSNQGRTHHHPKGKVVSPGIHPPTTPLFCTNIYNSLTHQQVTPYLIRG